TENYGMSDYNKSFDLINKSFGKAKGISQTFGRPKTSQDGIELVVNPDSARLSYYSLDGCLYLKKNGLFVDSIPLLHWNGKAHNVFGFYGEEFIISCQDYGVMKAYDKKGNPRSSFIAHTGEIWGLSVTPDNKYIYTSSSDRTIRIWPTEKIGKGDTTKKIG